MNSSAVHDMPGGFDRSGMSSGVNFYYWPTNIASQRCMLVLEEKGLDYWGHIMNPFNGDCLSEDYMKTNNRGTVPTLIDHRIALTDTITIVRYVDSMFEPLGKDLVNRPLVNNWVQQLTDWDDTFWTYAYMPGSNGRYLRGKLSEFKRRCIIARMERHPSLVPLYRAKLDALHKLLENIRDPEMVNENMRQLYVLLDAAERQLAVTSFLCGDALSTGDCMLLPVLARIELADLSKEILEPRPNLLEYFQEMKKRPSFEKVVLKPQRGFSKMMRMLPTLVGIQWRSLRQSY